MVCSCSTVSICGDAYVPSVDVLLALLDHTIWLHFGTCKMALHQIKRRCWMQVITWVRWYMFARLCIGFCMHMSVSVSASVGQCASRGGQPIEWVGCSPTFSQSPLFARLCTGVCMHVCVNIFNYCWPMFQQGGAAQRVSGLFSHLFSITTVAGHCASVGSSWRVFGLLHFTACMCLCLCIFCGNSATFLSPL